MANSIVPSNFLELSKEFKTDEEGKGYVSRRGLARLCGVSVGNWGRGDRQSTPKSGESLSGSGIQVSDIKRKKGGSQKALVIAESDAGSKLKVGAKDSKSNTPIFTQEIDEYLKESGFDVFATDFSKGIPDLIAAEVIGFYDSEKHNPVAKKSSRAFRAIGLRALIQQSTGYKPSVKRKLTAEEIIEVCCLPVPTTWQRRFPEEYYEHLSRLTGLVVDGYTRPCYWAALTKELVYDYLPDGIYSEIKRCKDESGGFDKLHQYLSADGVEILEAHQKKVLHHMQGAASINQLRTALKQACTGQYQLVLL